MNDNTRKSERDTLKERADLMGLNFPPNITTDKLRELVNGELKGPETKTTTSTDKKQADTDVSDMIREQTRKVRVLISCNDPQMTEWEATPYMQISNNSFTLPKIVVPFNVEWHIPYAYYVFLKEQKCTIPVKKKDEKGRTITINKTISKYNIQDLPPLTEKELKELKQAQAMRDGVAKVD